MTPTSPKASTGGSEFGYHSIESFVKCAKKYQLGQVRKVRAPKVQEPHALAVGTLAHAGRARWFTTGFGTDEQSWNSVKNAVQEQEEQLKLPTSNKAVVETLLMLAQYTDHWSQQPRPTVLAAEYELGPVPFDGSEDRSLNRTARVDDVSYYPEGAGQLWLGDLKTDASGAKNLKSKYELHGQPMLQLLLWEVAPNGKVQHGPVAGWMIDCIKKPSYGSGHYEFCRIPMRYPAWVLSWFKRSFAEQIRAAASITWDSDALRNVTACSEMYESRWGGASRAACEFQALCKQGPDAANPRNYVFGDEAQDLRDYEPEPGAWKMPWE